MQSSKDPVLKVKGGGEETKETTGELTEPTLTEQLVFERGRHVKYFSYNLRVLPEPYASLDTSRMTLLYFTLSALDLLGGTILADLVPVSQVRAMVEWIYSLQVLEDEETGSVQRCGFRGSPYMGLPFDPSYTCSSSHDYTQYPGDQANIAMTYTALCCLKILGDDLSRVNKKGIIAGLKYLQRDSGSFSPTYKGGESDMRFTFCACAISTMLDDWSGVDQDRVVKFVQSGQRFDGGIGLHTGSEGHGGSTYTGIASLCLMKRLHELPNLPALLKWCVRAQGNGFVGRPNKPPDTCYSFWIGATLKLVGAHHLTSPPTNREFALSCQTEMGGFGKHPNVYPDLLHSYYGVCGLSVMGGTEGLRELDVGLGISKRASGVGDEERVQDIFKILEAQKKTGLAATAK